MKPAYTPDNTRSSVLAVLGLAVVVVIIAALIGLSDKPQVDAILISANATSGGAGVSPAASDEPLETNDETESISDDQSSDTIVNSDESQQDAVDAADASIDSTSIDPAPEDQQAAPEATREIIVVPPSEPTPTPEIVDAVEAVAEQDPEDADSEDQAEPAPSLPTTTGSVQGTFFTKSFENDDAVVSQNLVQISFSEDGSGAFQGVLDITFADGSHVLLNMSGPLVWLPTNPQVEAILEGAFTLDAVIDTDDVMTEDAELIISSLSAGSGSLCTTQCFGFTFPPQ